MERTTGEADSANKMFLWKPSYVITDHEIGTDTNKQTRTPSARMYTRLTGVSGCKGF
jgi:hypothetical protein